MSTAVQQTLIYYDEYCYPAMYIFIMKYIYN